MFEMFQRALDTIKVNENMLWKRLMKQNIWDQSYVIVDDGGLIDTQTGEVIDPAVDSVYYMEKLFITTTLVTKIMHCKQVVSRTLHDTNKLNTWIFGDWP